MTPDQIHKALASAQSSLMKGNLKDAEERVSGVLDVDPENKDALYSLAVIQRYKTDLTASESTLLTLLKVSPDFGRAWQEMGHLNSARSDPGRAMQAYETAVHFNPSLVGSWDALAKLQSRLGQPGAASQSRAKVVRLQSCPKPLLAVMHHLYEGRLLKAETLCRAYQKEHPTNTEGMRLLAEIGVRLNVLDDAETLLEHATGFEPNNVQCRLDYIQVLRKRQKFALSLQQSQFLNASAPDNPVFLSNIAIDLMHTGDFEGALKYFDQVLAIVPKDPVTLASKGHALKTWGRQEEAIASYKASVAAKESHGDGWYGLANLKTYRFSEDERDRMALQLKKTDLMPGDRIYLNFALAKAHEDSENYAEAFRALQSGNALKKQSSRYDADQMQAELEAQAQVATAEFLSRVCASGGCPAPDPIFIVGLPRAGSTLLEQVLASHSQVDGTLELPHILQAVQNLRGRPGSSQYPEALLDLSDEKARELGETYMESTRQYRAGAPFFTDKMPNNFRHIGLIKKILPNAKIIDARRNPVACCFSGFKQLFAEGQEFTYDLTDLGRYYSDYVRLMDHFNQAAPGMILRVQYEDMVADLETQVRRLLDFLGLPFEQNCVEFHKTERVVRTASSEQVREKINTKGLDAWRPFEPWLEPLKEALGDNFNREEQRS